MNKFFIKKIADLKAGIENIAATMCLDVLKKYLSTKTLPEEGFKLKEISTEETLTFIKSLKGKKSIGMDWICGYSLKLASPILVEEIQLLVNLTIRHGKYYQKWKYTKVLPGWKNKGTRHEAKYYRPISNICEVSKIPEKAVYEQVYSYLLENNLLHENHHGFLKHHSTATALQQIIDLWLKAAENVQLSAALFMDLSAGFDVISHRILLEKMKLYKFDQNTVNWFQSYLEDRFQCVQVESCFSPYLPVPWGDPQGSILGPLLFILLILELPEVPKQESQYETENPNENEEETTNENDNEDNEPETANENSETQIVIYADDNTPTLSDKDPLNLKERIEREAKQVTDWFQRNEMITSGDKTKLLIIGTKSNRSRKLENNNLVTNITVCNDTVTESTSEKLLGLIINNTLTWKQHLYGDDENCGLLKQLSQRIGILKRLRKYIPDTKFKQIVAGIFTSKVIYCITVWGRVWNITNNDNPERSNTISKKEMKKNQILQNKTMRLLTGMGYDTPVKTLLKKCNQLSVHQLVAFHTACQTYRIYTEKLPHYHYNRLFQNENEDGRNTRSKMKPIDFELSLAKGSFFFQASKIWGRLPSHIRNMPKLKSFKTSCRKWIQENIDINP